MHCPMTSRRASRAGGNWSSADLSAGSLMTHKLGRIESLEPIVSAGNLLFCSKHRILLDQLRQFPFAKHDDGPDALEMAVQLSRVRRPYLSVAAAGEYVRTCSGPRCGSFTRAGSSAIQGSICLFRKGSCSKWESSRRTLAEVCSERERIPVLPEHPWPVHRFVRLGVSVIRPGVSVIRLGFHSGGLRVRTLRLRSPTH